MKRERLMGLMVVRKERGERESCVQKVKKVVVSKGVLRPFCCLGLECVYVVG